MPPVRLLHEITVVVADIVERQAGRIRRATRRAAQSRQCHVARTLDDDLNIAAALLECAGAAALCQAAVLVADTLERQR